jgi:gluconokinase
MVIALDIGTSSTRAILYDDRGLKVEGAEHKVAHEPHTTPDGGVEHDASRLLDAAATCLDALASRGDDIRAVAVSTFWHGLLGFDRDGRAASPVYVWADTRSAAVAARLRQEIDEARVHERTGCRLHSSYWPAKLRWLQETGGTAGIVRWGSLGELLALSWFGEGATSISMASATGLFDQAAVRWDPEMLAIARVGTDMLFPLRDAGDAWRTLREPWASRWRALRGAAWFPAIGDGAASNVGSDCTTPQRIAVNVGTSSAMRIATTASPRAPEGLWRYRVDRQLSVLGGALSEGGNVYAWCLQNLALPDEAAVEKALAAAEHDHGLIVLPFLAGERSVGWHDQARGAITGMSLDTTAIDIVRAALESVALRLALIYERLAPMAAPDHEVVVSGGAFGRSPAWIAMVADALGRSLTVSPESEASSRGVALLALRALGLVPDLPSTGAPGAKRVDPEPRRTERYRGLLERQRRLYRAVLEG